jgi:hypothetical protein
LKPEFAFGPLRATDYGNFLLFVVSASLIVWLSAMYRRAVRALTEAEKERPLIVQEIQHRSHNLLAAVQAVINGTLADEKRHAL